MTTNFLQNFEESLTRLTKIKKNIIEKTQQENTFASMLKTKLSDIKDKIKNLATQIANLKQRCNEKQRRVINNNGQIQANEPLIAQLQQELKNKQYEFDAMRNNQRPSQNNQRPSNGLDAKNQEIYTIKKQLYDLQIIQQQLKNENEDLKKHIINTTEYINKVSGELEIIIGNVNRCGSEADENTIKGLLTDIERSLTGITSSVQGEDITKMATNFVGNLFNNKYPNQNPPQPILDSQKYVHDSKSKDDLHVQDINKIKNNDKRILTSRDDLYLRNNNNNPPFRRGGRRNKKSTKKRKQKGRTTKSKRRSKSRRINSSNKRRQ